MQIICNNGCTFYREKYNRCMFKKILKDNNISVTKQRLAILEALQNIGVPATIETIKKHITVSMDITTLYRSLSSFVEVGIVYQTDFREGVAYYELQHDDMHHHHLVCTRCRTKTEYHYCPDLPIDDIHTKTGFSVSNHMFEIFGLCKKCTKSS